MRIYDCFTFYNEFELLELRLETFYEYVDYFVISESNKTFRGEPKRLYLKERLSEFNKYKDKIKYIEQESTLKVNKTCDYSIEIEQRNALGKMLVDCDDDDIIILSDIDEFPSLDVLNNIRRNEECELYKLRRLVRKRKNKIKAYTTLIKTLYLRTSTKNLVRMLDMTPIVMGQEHFFYFLNNKYSDIWCGTTICKYKNLKTVQGLRDIRRRLPICKGGYHFSFMGGVDRILKKMNSTVDENPDRENIRRYTIEDVKTNLKNGTFMYDQQSKEKNIFSLIDYRELQLPYIEEFKKKYPAFFLE